MEKMDQYIALNLQNAALERGMEEANLSSQTDREQCVSLQISFAKTIVYPI